MPKSHKLGKLTSPFRIISGSINPNNRVIKVEFPGFEPEEVTYWQNRGFYQAIALPYEHEEIEGISVLVVRPLVSSNFVAQKYGFHPSVSVIFPKTSEIWRSVKESIRKEKLLPSIKNQ